MAESSQIQALRNYRKRLVERGMARFEVLGLTRDRELIRTVARRLAEDNAESADLRNSLCESVAPRPERKGGILAALRRSPLVGADITPARPEVELRKVEL